MCKKVIDLDNYKKDEERKLAEAKESFEGLDLSFENYTKIMNKLEKTKDSNLIPKIEIDELALQQTVCKMDKKINKK